MRQWSGSRPACQGAPELMCRSVDGARANAASSARASCALPPTARARCSAGLARLSRRSLLAVLTFMAAGFATVYVVRHLLGGVA